MKKIGNRPITEADTDFSKLQKKEKKEKKKDPKNFLKIFDIFFIFFLQFRKIGICFGNRPIANFFHDQTILLWTLHNRSFPE